MLLKQHSTLDTIPETLMMNDAVAFKKWETYLIGMGKNNKLPKLTRAGCKKVTVIVD